jgi:integrase
MENHSEIKVTPENWEKELKSNFKKEWYGYYYFFNEVYPKGKFIKFRGMNKAKTLRQKQEITRYLIENELKLLQSGYNPVTKKYETKEVDNLNLVSKNTLFINALKIASTKLKVSKPTLEGIEYAINIVAKFVEKTNLNLMKISEVRKRDIRLLLDEVIQAGYSNDRFNKVRAYLGILYNYFVDLEIFEYNYILSIKKLPHTPKKRVIMRSADKEKFEQLKGINYNLWRFCKMFYYSGSRISEFTNVKVNDVDLNKGEFIIFEKKGKQYHSVTKPINQNVLVLWEEILSKTKGKNTFIFGSQLSPDNEPISRYALQNRWKYWVKKTLGINVDLYALKHTYLNDVTRVYGISQAKDLAGHTSENTTRIYAVDYQEYLLEKQKQINTGF